MTTACDGCHRSTYWRETVEECEDYLKRWGHYCISCRGDGTLRWLSRQGVLFK